MSIVRAKDGAEIFHKDWGKGPAVVLSPGWPLNADSWDEQLEFLASNGYRAIAHDRRGHGRSTQTWEGNEMDTYADDLAELVAHLGLSVLKYSFSLPGRASPKSGAGHGRSPVALPRPTWECDGLRGSITLSKTRCSRAPIFSLCGPCLRNSL